jgi:SAM-dependent methyltransferase
MEQYKDGHLGGAVVGGDPATYYPNVWDCLIESLNVKSMIDVGCGEGQTMHYFQDKGVEVFGIDGCKEAIDNSLVKDKISLHDFTKGKFQLNKSYDLIWCCEFVEHVFEEFSENYLNLFSNSSAKYIVMTHALPNQGGHHHVNLQKPSYWIEKISNLGYTLDPTLSRQLRIVARLESIQVVYNHFYNTGLVFVRNDLINKEKKNRLNTAILTWMSGDLFCKNDGIKVFVNSLNDIQYNGNKIVFTHDMNLETREYLYKHEFEIIDVNPNQVRHVVIDRFLHYFKYLNNKNYYYIGLFDCKDVLFQSDPLISLPPLLFVSEGKKHKDCEWNMKDQTNCQNETALFDNDFQNWEVICGGTILGQTKEIQTLCISIWSLCNNKFTRFTDQAALNYLYNNIYNKYCCTNPYKDNFVCTANLPVDQQPILIDGLYCNAKTKEPYMVYHQYDRVESSKKYIYESYLNESI